MGVWAFDGVAYCHHGGHINNQARRASRWLGSRLALHKADLPALERGRAMVKDSLSGDPTLSLSAKQRIDRVCLVFEDAWRSGRQPQLEEYLADPAY